MSINSKAYFSYHFNKKPSSIVDNEQLTKNNNEIFRFQFAHAFIDHKLYMSHKAGSWANLAETYAPNTYCVVDEEIESYEFSITFSSSYQYDKSEFMACFIGVRVSSANGTEAN